MRPRRLHEHEIDTILQQKRICSGFIATENLIYHGERAYYLDRPANYSKPCYPTFCYRCCRCCWSSFILRNHLYSYAVVFSFLSFFHSFIVTHLLTPQSSAATKNCSSFFAQCKSNRILVQFPLFKTRFAENEINVQMTGTY